MNSIVKIILIITVVTTFLGLLSAITNPFVDNLTNTLIFLLGYINNLSPLVHVQTIFNIMLILWNFVFAAATFLLVNWLLRHFLK